MTIHIDFETRSRIDLLTHGAYIYAQDPSTEIICMYYAVDDGPVDSWWPGDLFPTDLLDYFLKSNPRSVHAHNSQFERLITKYVLRRMEPDIAPVIDRIKLTMWYCTASQARRRALPGGLDKLGRILNLPVQKSFVGKQLIRKLCVPWLNGSIDFENGVFNYDADLLRQMGEYCHDDVEVERAAAKMSPPLTDEEFDEFIISEEINDRGIRVDVELAMAAMTYAAEETEAIGQLLALETGGKKVNGKVVGGKITRPRQFARLKDYLAPYMAEDDNLRKIMTKHKTTKGITKITISLDKNARAKILLSEDDTFDPLVIRLTTLIDEASNSSTSKFKTMGLLAGADERVHGAYIWCGAAQTGRWSSVGLQAHNFTRSCAENPEELRELIVDDWELDNPLQDLASMLRPSLIADPGMTFVCGDWMSIEAVTLPWLSCTEQGEDLLDQYKKCFADPSIPDMYEREAEKMGTKDRQAGKVAILSCGYQGGFRAVQGMARNYNIDLSKTEAEEIKNSWRAANRWAPHMWGAFDRASMAAMRTPDLVVECGRCAYMFSENWDALYCILPSGKTLAYPQPRIEAVKTPWGSTKLAVTCVKAAWAPAAGSDDPWPRVALYGGMLAQGATQACAAEILGWGLAGMSYLGWPVVLHTHDEMAVEVHKDEVADCAKALRWVMTNGPSWSEGLPLACSIWTGDRYKK